MTIWKPPYRIHMLWYSVLYCFKPRFNELSFSAKYGINISHVDAKHHDVTENSMGSSTGQNIYKWGWHEPTLTGRRFVTNWLAVMSIQKKDMFCRLKPEATGISLVDSFGSLGTPVVGFKDVPSTSSSILHTCKPARSNKTGVHKLVKGKLYHIHIWNMCYIICHVLCP